MDREECFQEQADEHEALESMFLEDEFKILEPVDDEFDAKSTTRPSVELRLVPLPGEDEKNHVAVKLVVTYPPMYPETVPDLQLSAEKGLNSTQIKALTQILIDLAEENVGVPMVYTLAEAAKEWMQDRNEKSKGDGSAFERMQQRKREAERAKEKEQEKIDQRRQKKNEEQRKKEESTRQLLMAMTDEEFFTWRSAFESEMAAKELEESKNTKSEEEAMSKRISGRKIFEMGLAKGGAAMVRAAEEKLAEESAGVDAEGGESTEATKSADAVIDANLFTNDASADSLEGMDELIGDLDGILDDFE